MKVAAYQAPLLPAGSMEALPLIRARVAECERRGVEILCCPEAILGGLADFIPTNNGLPPEKADVVDQAHRAQAERAVENGVHVVAADVAGRCGDHVSWGSSAVTAPDGTLLEAAAEPLAEELLVVDLDR